MNLQQSREQVDYKVGEIVRYTGYENDLINYPLERPKPNKFFKVLKADMDWGVVDYGEDTIGVSYIRKTNFIEKIEWWLFWRDNTQYRKN